MQTPPRRLPAFTARCATRTDKTTCPPQSAGLTGARVAAGFADASSFSLHGPDIEPLPIFVELGFVASEATPDAGVEDLSLESLDVLDDADLIVVTADPVEEGYEPDLTAQEAVRTAVT